MEKGCEKANPGYAGRVKTFDFSHLTDLHPAFTF